MNVLFMSLMEYRSVSERDIYTDLLREFIRNGHKVFLLSPTESQGGVIVEENCTICQVPTGKIEKVNFIRKGINTLLIEGRFKAAIKKHFSDVHFDMVLYPTPPITFVGAVAYVKKRDRAKTYLMLKDIFPQNAVDIGVISKQGFLGLIYRFFRQKERQLYHVSDYIGCMSRANAAYVLKHNPKIEEKKVGICPNCAQFVDRSVTDAVRRQMREKYGIPQNRTVFVYGGNLGKPQGIPFLIDCLKSQKDNQKTFFLVVGDGTEYELLEQYRQASNQDNFMLMQRLPKEDYDTLVGACDVGMLFLDHRFTIPNFPSRMLSYMQARLPILACTDPNTDVGKVICEGGFGWWCESSSVEAFQNAVDTALQSNLLEMGRKSMEYLLGHYTEKDGYRAIISAIEE